MSYIAGRLFKNLLHFVCTIGFGIFLYIDLNTTEKLVKCHELHVNKLYGSLKSGRTFPSTSDIFI